MMKLSSLFTPKTTPYYILAVMMFVSGVLMFSVSHQESAVVDEIPYISSGFSYLNAGDYRLDPEHPPLLKMLGGIPLLFLDLNFPYDSVAWKDNVNDQWTVGRQFLYELGNDPNQIISFARIGPIFLTLLFIFCMYVWSVPILGRRWALLPAFLLAVSPTILAHGHYVTTDVGTAFATVLAIYCFFKASKEPSFRNIIFAGLALGVAVLTKFSSLILIPYFIWIECVFLLNSIVISRKSSHRFVFTEIHNHFLESIKKILKIFFIAFILIYILYSLVIINYSPERQKSDTTSLLSIPAKCVESASKSCILAKKVIGVNIWASDKVLLRPMAEYSMGVIMTGRRAVGGGPSYLFGDVSLNGWWYYFPVVYAMKEPLPVLILVVAAFLLGLIKLVGVCRKKEIPNFIKHHQFELGLVAFAVVFMVASMRSPLNIGIRYILPVIPCIYILTAYCLKNWKTTSLLSRKIKITFIVIILLWSAVDTARAYPYYLSYFNEFIQTKNGWLYAIDSNYDWGQDVKRLATFVEENDISKIAVDCFPCGSPKAYLGERSVEWSSRMGNPKEKGIQWLAVSIHTIQQARGNLTGGASREPEEEYRWLENIYEPHSRAGTSFFVYKLF
ncbi:MAG: glycosyltransferase family 39 protein [Patescibacteria group bacterium]